MRTPFLALLAFAIACSGTTTPTADGTAPVTLQPDGAIGKDVWITSVFDYGDDYGVDDEKLQVGGWGDWYHSLLQFDLAGLPSQAVTATVVLQPFSRGDASTPVSMELYRSTSSWTEATGWPTRPQGVFVASLPAPQPGIAYTIDVTTLYNGWKSGAFSNFGLELRPNATNNRFNVFRSSDYRADPLLRPKLLIVPSTTTAPDRFTWPTDPQNASTGQYAPCGDNPTCYWLTLPNGWRDVQPFLKYPYTSPRTGNIVYHLGADWNRGTDSQDAGDMVYAAGDGEIVKVVSGEPGFGRMIFIQHRTSFGDYVSVYAHVDWLSSGEPQRGLIRRGAPIARVGNGAGSGVTYPYHLHFEVRSGTNVDAGNGYASSQTGVPPQGQIDPNLFIASHR